MAAGLTKRDCHQLINVRDQGEPLDHVQKLAEVDVACGSNSLARRG